MYEERIAAAHSYQDLLTIAKEISEKLPRPRIQICGPMTTGGKGSAEENIVEQKKAITHFQKQGYSIFDQTIFFSKQIEIAKKYQEI